MISLALVLHLIAAILWVGGMFFAYVILRPAAAAQLGPPQRQMLWRDVFVNFFRWVWAVVILLPVTGLWLIFALFGRMGDAPLYVHLMLGLGLVMIIIFLHLYFAPYRRFRGAVARQEWQAGGEALAGIRRLVGINLVLGLVVAAVVAAGRFGYG